MKRIWLENHRCFREHQDARLAPLTLLVGDKHGEDLVPCHDSGALGSDLPLFA